MNQQFEKSFARKISFEKRDGVYTDLTTRYAWIAYRMGCGYAVERMQPLVGNLIKEMEID